MTYYLGITDIKVNQERFADQTHFNGFITIWAFMSLQGHIEPSQRCHRHDIKHLIIKGTVLTGSMNVKGRKSCCESMNQFVEP